MFHLLPHVLLKTVVVLCCFWLDPLFELKADEKDALVEALQQPWQVQEKAKETDISALQWVEDLEQRVIAADLHLKVSDYITVVHHVINLTVKTTATKSR